MSDELLSMDGIAQRFGVSTATVRSWRRREQLPEPDVVHGPRRLLWRRSTIDAWRR